MSKHLLVFFQEGWDNLLEDVLDLGILLWAIWLEEWSVELANLVQVVVTEAVSLVGLHWIAGVVSVFHAQKSQDGVGLSAHLPVDLQGWNLSIWHGGLHSWPVCHLVSLVLERLVGVGEEHSDGLASHHEWEIMESVLWHIFIFLI